MIEKTLDITTKDGEMETFICHPERNGPSPAVFLLMDAHGIREELKDMARRLGTVGYYVLLPGNLILPRGPRYDLWTGCAGGGERRTQAHAGRPHQDGHLASDGFGHGLDVANQQIAVDLFERGFVGERHGRHRRNAHVC